METTGGGWGIMPSPAAPVTILGPGGTIFPSTSIEVGTPADGFVFVTGISDANGNSTLNYPAGLDSLGRPIVTQTNGTNQVIYTVHASDGSTQTYTVNYSNISINTAFSFGANYQATRPAVTSIVLPNGSFYAFSYDAYGSLTNLTLPTGASVTYTWANYGSGLTIYRYVTSRALTVNGVTSSWTFSRTPGTCPSGQSGCDIVTVTDPLQNQSVYAVFIGQTLSARIYNGTASGTPLRQYTIDYSPYQDGSELPFRVTTQLENGLVRKTEYTYDALGYPVISCTDDLSCENFGPTTQTVTTSRGNVTEIDDYDWGSGSPGPLLRKIVKTYLHDSNSAYIAPNIVDKVLTDTTYDGSGNQIAQTQYEYDNYVLGDNPLQASTNAPQHDYTNYSSAFTLRGNVTRVKQWRKTDGALLTTTYTYDDLGNIRAVKDPLSHTTSFDFTDSFANTACPPPSNSLAYLSTVTNALGHQSKISRYPCTGLVASRKDQNDINAGRAGTTYSYDFFGRVTLQNAPDGGQISTSYNDTPPLNVTSATKVTASLNLVRSSFLDGLGRSTQTQLTSDPQGTVFGDTTYDLLGRISTTSNPYRSTSDSTYGITTMQYDILNRVTQLVPADGSTSANNVTTTYAGNAITVTDQAGNPRRSFTDGLGRLIEVDEPGGGAYPTSGGGSSTIGGSEQSISGASATPGSGSSTVSGSEQSIAAVPATSGTGSSTVAGSEKSVAGTTAASGTGYVTVSGAEQPYICDPAGPPLPQCQKLYDSGIVTVVVNGFTAQKTYGQGSTLAGIVSALNSALNASGSPVNSIISGSTLNLTAKTTGAATNYALSVSYHNDDPTDFPSPSFSASGSGPALTGGRDFRPTTYDSGTAWVTINGAQYSVNYGQNSSSATIASALASAMSAGSLVNATANGAGISFTAKTTGAGTNYSLSSGSSSSLPGTFSPPSFSVSVSGGSMTGGTNGSAAIYDSGNAWVTVNGTRYSVSYGQSSTSATIASALASAMSAGSLVNASASGSGITITSKTNGAATNYSLSSGSNTTSGSFASVSFSVSVSGGALTGGTDVGPTTYDSGSVWINVNGTQYTVSYGQGSTVFTVADALAAALNGNTSPVRASVSGTTITLTAKAVGSSSNYSLSSGSSTNQAGSFGSPSFSASLSGGALTGGANGTPFSLSTPAITLYSYDTLGNLTCVVQKGTDTSSFTSCAAAPAAWRPRSFTYNSLSQLLAASNPESGMITYTYDNNGNVLTKADARGITTTLAYDALNRLTGKTYSNGDPSVVYRYDESACLGAGACSNIGRRTSMSDAGGSEAWSYDALGRALFDQRTTNGISKTTSSSYNLDGSVAALTYPSGRTITYTPNAAGQTVSAVDSANNLTYATGALYSPSGGLSSLTNGSIVSTFYFNNRLQPCRISVKSTGTAPSSCSNIANIGNILDYSYNFNLGANDNGNVTAITNNRDTTRSQSFTYDPLNRLTAAQTTSSYSSSPPHCWGESFGYDSWGNLLSVSESASSYDGCTSEQPQAWTINARNQMQSSTTCFDASGNLLTVTTYCYDAAGNLLTDTARSYSYDAENHLKSIPMLGISYLYDGDGRRVAKLNSSGQATKLYWYGIGSDPLDETDGTGAISNGNFFEYAFFNGKRVARRDASNNVSYYFADHLGTSRVVTNVTGTILDDSDFYPFGGERPVTSSSGNTYKFTGKERDSESGLDEFGARYYSSSLGRFMIPDWAAKPTTVPYANFGNPQSLNLFSYVNNNPTTIRDLDGHCPDGMDVCFMPQLAQDPNYMAGQQKGAAIGALLVAGGAALAASWEAGAIYLRNLIGLGLATAPRTAPIIADAIEGLTPGSPGSLTISSATRLSEQEISTGVRLANQSGKALAESAHVGEEFVDAAGKTYDAMGGGKAFEHFGDGSKFFDSIMSHINKSVDQVAIDLKGASKEQVGAIKDFVKTLTKTQQKKITYVQ